MSCNDIRSDESDARKLPLLATAADLTWPSNFRSLAAFSATTATVPQSGMLMLHFLLAQVLIIFIPWIFISFDYSFPIQSFECPPAIRQETINCNTND